MKNKPLIAKVSLPIPVNRLFDYLIPKKLSGKVHRGMRVNVLFNRRNETGYVVDLCFNSQIKKLNPIINVLDEGPIFSGPALQLAKKVRDYYVCSLGEAIDSMLPGALKHSKNINSIFSFNLLSKRQNRKARISYFQSLSEDETLSYLKEEIVRRVRRKKRIILVVPEIRMIESIGEYFKAVCDINLRSLHGRIPKKCMLNLWDELSKDKIDLIIGTRSSIFAPMKNLDLIIIHDEGNFSHKEDQVPYYHSVKIAMLRSEIEKCDVILTSFIPSSRVFQLISMNNNASKTLAKINTLADIQLTGINYRDKMNIILEREIEAALGRKEKILIFLNRKGFATFIYCRRCKKAIKCLRCSNNLRFDFLNNCLVCSRCNSKTESSEICPECNSSYVRFSGLGVEKLESNLKRVFPMVRIATAEKLLKGEEGSVNYDVVVGTREVLNLREFRPDITIVWDFDALLNIGDYKAGEETYRFLSRLLSKTSKKMFISTGLKSDFYLFKYLKNANYKEFYRLELRSRKDLKLPPYYHIGRVFIRGKEKGRVESVSIKIKNFIENINKKNLKVYNFYGSSSSRLRGKYCRYLYAKSSDPKILNRSLKKILEKFRSYKTIVTVDIDPI